MGAHLVRRYVTERDTEPDPRRKFEFDPQFGFPERKERGLSIVHAVDACTLQYILNIGGETDLYPLL